MVAREGRGTLGSCSRPDLRSIVGATWVPALHSPQAPPPLAPAIIATQGRWPWGATRATQLLPLQRHPGQRVVQRSHHTSYIRLMACFGMTAFIHRMTGLADLYIELIFKNNFFAAMLFCAGPNHLHSLPQSLVSIRTDVGSNY